uniref:Glycolipid transfer protein domain-containing protein n=1 Tax=Aegilops tauschii subsp. strangulata TaxID=200361 RepID=A0A453C109_AEGTS
MLMFDVLYITVLYLINAPLLMYSSSYCNITRSMDFTVALLQRLEKEEEEEEEEEGSDQQSLAQLVEDAYKVSLKPWHGWISSAACKVRG